MSKLARATKATLIPCLRYRNAPAAIDWLSKVFGFEKQLVVPGSDGTIAHAQLSFGNGMIMLGSVSDTEYGRLIKQPDEIGGSETQSPYVIVTDADAVYARARPPAPRSYWTSRTRTTAGAASAAVIWKAVCGTSAPTIRGPRPDHERARAPFCGPRPGCKRELLMAPSGHVPWSPPATAGSGGHVSIGHPVARLEDERLLRGGSRYVSDLIATSGALRVKVLRSPHAHARILHVDATDALTRPGVAAALTADDLAGIGDLPCDWVPAGMAVVPQHPILARDQVRYAGEPVAAVAAETASSAEDALAAITVAYEKLPAVADQETAMEEGAPCLHEAVPRNIAYSYRRAAGDIDRAFAEAEVVVRRRLTNSRVTAAPLEGRAVLSAFDIRTGRLTHHTSSQLPHAHARSLGECLGLPLHRLRLVAPDVGGGFGAKLGFYAEDVICALLSMRTGRPCAWAEGRRESFLATTHGRDHIQYAELAAGRDGRISGLRTRLIADLGAYALGMGPGVPAINAGLSVTGPYRIPNVDTEVLGVYTNRTPTGPYRGAGHPEATFLIERLVDDLARELARDPADVRRANFVLPSAMPYRLPTGLTLDSGEYAATLDAALTLAGYADCVGSKRVCAVRAVVWVSASQLSRRPPALDLRWRWRPSAFGVPATRARVWWSTPTGARPCSPVRKAPGRAMPRLSPRLRPVCLASRSMTSTSWKETPSRPVRDRHVQLAHLLRSAVPRCTRQRAESWTRPRGLRPTSCRGAPAISSTRTVSFARRESRLSWRRSRIRRGSWSERCYASSSNGAAGSSFPRCRAVLTS